MWYSARSADAETRSAWKIFMWCYQLYSVISHIALTCEKKEQTIYFFALLVLGIVGYFVSLFAASHITRVALRRNKTFNLRATVNSGWMWITLAAEKTPSHLCFSIPIGKFKTRRSHGKLGIVGTKCLLNCAGRIQQWWFGSFAHKQIHILITNALLWNWTSGHWMVLAAPLLTVVWIPPSAPGAC